MNFSQECVQRKPRRNKSKFDGKIINSCKNVLKRKVAVGRDPEAGERKDDHPDGWFRGKVEITSKDMP